MFPTNQHTIISILKLCKPRKCSKHLILVCKLWSRILDDGNNNVWRYWLKSSIPHHVFIRLAERITNEEVRDKYISYKKLVLLYVITNVAYPVAYRQDSFIFTFVGDISTKTYYRPVEPLRKTHILEAIFEEEVVVHSSKFPVADKKGLKSRSITFMTMEAVEANNETASEVAFYPWISVLNDGWEWEEGDVVGCKIEFLERDVRVRYYKNWERVYELKHRNISHVTVSGTSCSTVILCK